MRTLMEAKLMILIVTTYYPVPFPYPRKNSKIQEGGSQKQMTMPVCLGHRVRLRRGKERSGWRLMKRGGKGWQPLSSERKSKERTILKIIRRDTEH
jgi:hypothetical protein